MHLIKLSEQVHHWKKNGVKTIFTQKFLGNVKMNYK